MKTSLHSIKLKQLHFGKMQHMQFIAYMLYEIHCIAYNVCNLNKRKIWKPKQYKITVTLLPRNILQLQLRS